MALSNSEDSEVFEFVFQFIDSKCRNPPSAIMADGDKAARKAAKKVFPLATLLMCWWHMLKNVKKNTQWLKHKDEEVYNDIIGDLSEIQIYPLDEETFNVVYGLFIRKYSEEYNYSDTELKNEVCQRAIPYINKVWVQDSDVKNWYQASNPMVR